MTNKSTKNEGPSENEFYVKTVSTFQMKKKFLAKTKQPRDIHGPQMQQLKLELLELGKTRTKKASLDMFNFYVVLAGHDKVTDAGRAATCRCKFKVPSL